METIYSLAIMMSVFLSEVLTFVSFLTMSLNMMVIMMIQHFARCLNLGCVIHRNVVHKIFMHL